MAMARGEVVERLCKGATEGMMGAAGDDINSSDVFSAFMTMALRQIVYAVKHGGDVDAIREAVQELWAALPKETTN